MAERTRRQALGGRLVLIVLTTLVLLFFLNPAQHRVFPQCLFLKFTGWHCPGCGAMRAVHELLHGNLSGAFRDNALLVIALPFILWQLSRFVVRLSRGEPASFRIPARWFGVILVVLVMFEMWRNFTAGAWLSP